MTWGKLDCRWYEAERLEDARGVTRAEALAAWSVVMSWCVEHATGGAIATRRAERLLAYVLEVDVERAGAIAAALVASGAWELEADQYRIAGWDQPDLGVTRGQAAARQRRRRVGAEAMSDGVGLSRVTGMDTSRVTDMDTSRVTGSDMSRSQIRSDQIRSEEIRSDTPSECAERVRPHTSAPAPAPAREASTSQTADAPPTAARTHSEVECVSPQAEDILAAMRRHRRLDAVASPELASTIDGRRMTSGASMAEVVQAIGDAAAHAEDGITTAALRRMLVAYTDRARGGGARGRGRPGPAQSVVPIERAWQIARVGER